MSFMSFLIAPSPPASANYFELARSRYYVRVVGMALAYGMLASVLYEKQVHGLLWLLPFLHCFLGPHLGWFLLRRVKKPRKMEQFNLLPLVLGLLLLGLQTLADGGPRLLWRGVLVHALGVLLGGLLFGWHWHPHPSMLVLLASLPLLVFQPVVVSLVARKTIEALQEKRVELEHLSQHDGLSGLYNRSHWERLVRAEFARFRRGKVPAVLVLADLDHFKRVNDEHGHAAGDEVIRRFAAALGRVFRETDVCGRYGGEEFGMLLPLTSGAAARDVIERLRRDMQETPLLDAAAVTASFGVAELTAEVTSVEVWLRLADQMLYRAKHLGRDRVVVLGEEVPSVPSPLEVPVPAQPSFSTLAELGDPQEHAHLMSGLDTAPMPLALFDPSDRLALANPAYIKLFDVQPSAVSFGDIMRHCHTTKTGPTVLADNVDDWLRAADTKRRSQSQRNFLSDTYDGRLFHVFETSYADGWLLVVLFDVTNVHDMKLTRMLPPSPSGPAPDPDSPTATDTTAAPLA
jgi:diguanylate cyclase